MNRIFYIFSSIWLTFFTFFINGNSNHKNNQIIEKNTSIIKKLPTNEWLLQNETTEKSDPLSSFKDYTIGQKTDKGSKTLKESFIEIIASGSDFGGKKDQGFFFFNQLKGDFEISVRIHSLTLVDLYTKAGIMARSDLADNSDDIFFYVFPDNQERINNRGGCEFQYRPKRGEETQKIFPNQRTTGNNFNVDFVGTWIKLKREGNSFTSYISEDKINWHTYTSHHQRMPKSLLVGLAVTSNSENEFTRAEFSELQIQTFK